MELWKEKSKIFSVKTFNSNVLRKKWNKNFEPLSNVQISVLELYANAYLFI